MSADEKEDVHLILDHVINKINRITEHLRDKGENEAATKITSDMTNMLKNLYAIIAPWDIEKCLMKPPPRSHASITARSRVQQPGESSKCMSTPLSGATWAAIAATEPVAGNNGLIKFRPSDALQIKVLEHNLETCTFHDEFQDRRVLWVRPWTADRPLKEITKKMANAGAIFSMAYDPEAKAVCIIFQLVDCATDFKNRCELHAEHNGIPLFGPNYEVAYGLPYPVNRDLARMDAPSMHRRRLTFARAGLFNKDGVTQDRFRKDIEEIAGFSNVELLWFFNSGNATVVFSAVPLARLVRESFLRYGQATGSPYHLIMVSYSHDPCERDMHLVSQIPGHPGYLGGASVAAPGSRPRGSTFGSTASSSTFANGGNSHYSPAHRRRITGFNGLKPQADNDGWQTVKRGR